MKQQGWLDRLFLISFCASAAHDELAFFTRRRRIYVESTMTTQDKTAQATGTMPGSITDEAILKIAKEIAVKFIEVGRITPAGFATAFATIYSTIEKTVRKK
jgi:hypothetical protein